MREALLLLLALMLLALPAISASSNPPKKAAPAAKAKKPATASPSKAKTASKTTARKRSARAAKARRPSGPPRQTEPTPERYREIQQAMADKGYYEGTVDGKWGATSVEALKRFQADHGLAPDGKLGALSLISLGLGPKREPLPPAAQFDSKPAGEDPQ